jgi:hypothetical protein
LCAKKSGFTTTRALGYGNTYSHLRSFLQVQSIDSKGVITSLDVRKGQQTEAAHQAEPT